jgi:hypothetical protein
MPVDARRVQQAHDGRGALARAQATGEHQLPLPSAIRRIWFSTQLF